MKLDDFEQIPDNPNIPIRQTKEQFIDGRCAIEMTLAPGEHMKLNYNGVFPIVKDDIYVSLALENISHINDIQCYVSIDKGNALDIVNWEMGGFHTFTFKHSPTGKFVVPEYIGRKEKSTGRFTNMRIRLNFKNNSGVDPITFKFVDLFISC